MSPYDNFNNKSLTDASIEDAKAAELDELRRAAVNNAIGVEDRFSPTSKPSQPTKMVKWVKADTRGSKRRSYTGGVGIYLFPYFYLYIIVRIYNMKITSTNSYLGSKSIWGLINSNSRGAIKLNYQAIEQEFCDLDGCSNKLVDDEVSEIYIFLPSFVIFALEQ